MVAADATAWAEVKLEDAGWVAFDPVPDPGVELAPPPEDVAGNDPTEDTQPPPPEADEEEGDDDEAVEEEEATSAADFFTDPRVIVLGVVALVMVALALPGVLRWRRRERRRRAATATARVAGAWDEALDELVAAGVRPTPDQTSRAVAALGQEQIGEPAEPLSPLATIVNRSLFAPTKADGPDAAAAWSLVDRFQADRRSDLPSSRRVREYFARRARVRG